MFIKIGCNIINVNEIVYVRKTKFYIQILTKGCEKEFTAFRSDCPEDVTKEFERICSILVPES